jgi:hypothetical protein
MNSVAPIGEKRRGFRRWRWLAYCQLGSRGGTLLLGNLALFNLRAYRQIAFRIKQHTGTETRIGGACRSLWNCSTPLRAADNAKFDRSSAVTYLRGAFDLEAFGKISQLFLRLGKDSPIVNL